MTTWTHWFSSSRLGGGGSCSPAPLGFQELVDLADRDRALADGGGDALDRATAYVAHGEHAVAAGLERAVVGVDGGSGEHEALPVQRDLPLEPAGVGSRTDQHEQSCRRDALLRIGVEVVQQHPVERFVPDELAHLAVAPDLDAWRLLDAVSQVAGHVPPQVVVLDYHVDHRRLPGQEAGRLTRGVAATDDGDGVLS